MARRGKPTDLYSDNGTMYVGTHNELKDLYRFLASNSEEVGDALANQNIAWHFIPPHAPNFGGVWEAAVKSVKVHLKRMIGDNSITIDDFLTLIIGIEGILNSRPLWPLSNDPNDLQPLTPSHFLIGRSIAATPEVDQQKIAPNCNTNFRLLQELQRQYWTRWSKEYLTELQQRAKWHLNSNSVKIGTLVIIKEDHLPPFSWTMARVTELHPGKDGIIRVVTLQTSKGKLKRPVNKVCPLPNQ